MTIVAQSPDLLTAARGNDPQALETMFRQFIDDNEELVYSRFLGRRGVFGFGPQCFAAVTSRRVACIMYSRFGEVTYQDGFLDKVTSSVVFQPSRLWLLLMQIFVLVLAIPTLGAALLVAPFVASVFYRFQKSGVAFVVGDGVPVFLFCDRNLIRHANKLQRHAMDLARKDQRPETIVPQRPVTDALPQRALDVTVNTDPPGKTQSVGGSSNVAIAAIGSFIAALGLALNAGAVVWYAEHTCDVSSRIENDADRQFTLATGRSAPSPYNLESTREISEYISEENLSEDERLALSAWFDEIRDAEHLDDRWRFLENFIAPGIGVAAGVALFIGIILTVIWLCHLNDGLPTELQPWKTQQLAVLLILPIINLVMSLFVFRKLAKRWDQHAKDTGVSHAEAPTGIATAISWTILIPYINLVVCSILTPIYIRRTELLKSAVLAQQTESDQSNVS